MGRSLSHVCARATIAEMPFVCTNGILMVVNIAFNDSTKNAYVMRKQRADERGAMQQSNGDWKGPGGRGWEKGEWMWMSDVRFWFLFCCNPLLKGPCGGR